MKTRFVKTSIRVIPTDKGLSLEETIRRSIASNAPLEGNAPKIYTEAKNGVMPQYDVRTDKHDLALEANDKYQGSEHMKGFIGQQEFDENGFDGKKFKHNDEGGNKPQE